MSLVLLLRALAAKRECADATSDTLTRVKLPVQVADREGNLFTSAVVDVRVDARDPWQRVAALAAWYDARSLPWSTLADAMRWVEEELPEA